MGDVPHAHGNRQPSAFSEHENTAQRMNMEQLQGKSFTAPGEQAGGPPFYSQLDGFPQHHATAYANYQPQPPMHRLDMSSLGATLPDGSSPTSMRGFPSQSSPYVRGMPQQLSNTMNYRPPMPQYGTQPYLPNMAMHASMPRVQQHPPSFPPHFYGTYAPPAQISLPPQGQPIAAYSTMPGAPYGKPEVVAQQLLSQTYPGLVGRDVLAETTPSYPRGPPRKPKQSGHALWVGNLPPGTTIIALKDHFSRDATKDIESLFLISKSNCAFVNYRTEEACAAAMTRFHDSRFQGVRLVCRLRRGTPTNGSPGPIEESAIQRKDSKDKSPQEEMPKKLSDPIIVASSSSQSPKKEIQHDMVDGVDGVDGTSSPPPARVPEKYFIVKSLTLQDLEASVRNGVWATQAHNEVALNKAYESADNVYLVFSANKSGEYFGYARMISPIASESVPLSSKPRSEHKETNDGPKSIPTPATQWAPEGRIVDDSARGTIFWEAASAEPVEDGVDGVAPQQQHEEEDAGSRQTQEWGKPFRVEWISTTRLPFYRTRGLRNPWNENREIKIARDGTEIEPSIGQRLVQMFHRPAPLPQGVISMAPTMPPVTGLFPN